MIITVDGPSGTGKSTIAKELAQRLSFNYCNSGAMYRTIACAVVNLGIDPMNSKELIRLLDAPPFEFIIENNRPMKLLLQGKPVGDEILTKQIAETASQIALVPEIRNYVNRIQKQYGLSGNVIFEGRGLGSDTFPEADFKIFLTADPTTRAQRRLKDLKDEGSSFEKVLEDLEKRDIRDASRKWEPLKVPEGALIIDSSHLTITQVIEKICDCLPNGIT